MGTVIEKCTSKCKKEEEEDNYIAPPRMDMSLNMNENNRTPVHSTKSPTKYKLFKNQFDRDPMEEYQIISQDNNQHYILVNSKTNTSIKRLIKIISGQGIINDATKNESFLKEAETLQSLDIQNICKLYEVYLHNNNYYLICDNYKENNLKDKITNGSTFDESTIKIIIKQILNIVTSLHEKNVFNIGLKLEDIVLNETISGKGRKRELGEVNNSAEGLEKKKTIVEKKYEVKIPIVDYLNEEYERTDINDIVYYSPEIIEQNENNDFIKRNYKEKQSENYITNTYDEWACGIILYYIIAQEFPFKGETNKELYSNIKSGSIDFSSPKFDSISPECKDLISKLLDKDKSNRIKCNECFDHPFLSDKPIEPPPPKVEKLNENVDIETLKSLLKVQKPRSKYHEIIIAYMCMNFLDKEEEQKINKLFKYLDHDNKNAITEENIKEVFTINEIEFTQENINKILYVFDYDENKLIQYQEFLIVLCDKKKLFNTDNLTKVFNIIDVNKNNTYITDEELKNFANNDENLKKIIGEEPVEPFGLKPENQMNLIQFFLGMKENKNYPEILGKKKTGRKLK